MTHKTIEIEAGTFEEARERVRLQVPEGLCLLSAKVISDGKPKTVRGESDTTESAYAEAQRRILASVVSWKRRS